MFYNEGFVGWRLQTKESTVIKEMLTQAKGCSIGLRENYLTATARGISVSTSPTYKWHKIGIPITQYINMYICLTTLIYLVSVKNKKQ